MFESHSGQGGGGVAVFPERGARIGVESDDDLPVDPPVRPADSRYIV
jgi:hypothetical protein